MKRNFPPSLINSTPLAPQVLARLPPGRLAVRGAKRGRLRLPPPHVAPYLRAAHRGYRRWGGDRAGGGCAAGGWCPGGRPHAGLNTRRLRLGLARGVRSRREPSSSEWLSTKPLATNHNKSFKARFAELILGIAGEQSR